MIICNGDGVARSGILHHKKRQTRVRKGVFDMTKHGKPPPKQQYADRPKAILPGFADAFLMT